MREMLYQMIMRYCRRRIDVLDQPHGDTVSIELQRTPLGGEEALVEQKTSAYASFNTK
jgi:hypothetical protein